MERMWGDELTQTKIIERIATKVTPTPSLTPTLTPTLIEKTGK